MSDIYAMRPSELLRGVARLAGKRGLPVDIAEGANHTKLRLGNRRTVVPRHAADLKTGTFKAILKQLGLTENDLEG
jgi:mRNA interferase HicA